MNLTLAVLVLRMICPVTTSSYDEFLYTTNPEYFNREY